MPRGVRGLRRAGAAAIYAQEQDKFWEYHSRLYHNQGSYSDQNFKSHATALGLDRGAFNTCLDSGRHLATIQKQYELAREQQVQYTPTFRVNGRLMIGSPADELWGDMLERILAQAAR